jgi:tetratricopeptide (TPR) repeat protein
MFRFVLGAGLILALGAQTLFADNIIRQRSNIENVTVIRETFKKVFYYPPGGMKIEQSQDYIENKVIRVEYDMWPEEWENGKAALANSQFTDAYDLFMEMTKASKDQFPQAIQYGLFWAAETIRKAAEAGSGNPAEALGIYDKLLKRVPETVHLAKVLVGRGKCLLLLGKKAEALAEFNRVPGEKYFKPADKVDAKVQMALIAELEGKYRVALQEYNKIQDEAVKVAPAAVPLVKVRMGACKVGLGKFDEALGDFNRILTSADQITDLSKKAEVKAAAYNGRGECYWKKKEYENGMWDFLRVIVLYETVTSESPKAFWHASECMKNMAGKLRKEGNKDEARMWRGRSRELYGELKKKFPGSFWANK